MDFDFPCEAILLPDSHSRFSPPPPLPLAKGAHTFIIVVVKLENLSCRQWGV